MVNEAIKNGLKKSPKWWRWLYPGILVWLNGCTYSIIMTHSEGESKDVVDQNQSASPPISADISLSKDS